MQRPSSDHYFFENFKQKNGDKIDWLNYAFTPSIFVILSVVLFGQSIIADIPIQCWMPEELNATKHDEIYFTNYCYSENKCFVVPENGTVSSPESEEYKHEQRYYGWILFSNFHALQIPMISIIQIFYFVLPKIFWEHFSMKTSLNLEGIIRNSSEKSFEDESIQKRYSARVAAVYIREIIEFYSQQKFYFFDIFPAFEKTKYVTFVYLFYKFLNCLAVFAHLYTMAYIFGGFGVFTDLMMGKSWRLTGNFPRETFCVVMVRDEFYRPINYTVKCILKNNMYYEKLYVFLCFWFMILTLLNILNLSQWIYTSFNKQWTIRFIKDQLDFANTKYTIVDVPSFIEEWIKMDGITAIRLISITCGDMVSSEIVKTMVALYKYRDEGTFKWDFDGYKFVKAKPSVP